MSNDGQILVRRGMGAWEVPAVRSYDSENHLQSLLAADPARIPGVAPNALTVVELPTVAGPIDICVVGRDGTLTVIECKLASNSERRRMVLGQVVDYAAAIWSTGIDTFIESWHRRGGTDLRTTLGPEALDQLSRNIQHGRINLCLAVDLIDADLRRLVEYLNQITIPEVAVTALQLAYRRHDDIEMLISTTFGGEIAEAKARSSAQREERWTCDRYIDALTDSDDQQRASRLFDLAAALSERRGRKDQLWFGVCPGGGVFFHPYGLERAPFQLWVNAKGQAMIYGNWTVWSAIAGHEGFAPLAAVLGQDHRGPQRGVRLADVDVDTLWEAALLTAEAINT